MLLSMLVFLNVGKVSRVSDAPAQAWFAADARVAAIVVHPWVLVQEVTLATDHEDRL